MIRRPLALVALLAIVTAGCSDDGRTLAPVGEDQTTTTTTVAPDVEPVAPDTFTLQSAAFPDGTAIPVEHTCSGTDISPALAWTNAPPATELAIVVRDRQADGFVHWIVTGIDPTFAGFGPGAVPEGSVEQANSTGAIGWLGPCPPVGSGTHFYDFVLHALDERVDIDPALPAADAAALIETSSSVEAMLSGTFSADGAPPGDADTGVAPEPGSQAE